MGSHNLYVNHSRWSDFGEEVEDILDVSLSKPTDLWATATDRATAGISCAMIERRDFDALEAELSWSIAKEGDEERTETEEKNVKTVVRRRNFGRAGREGGGRAGRQDREAHNKLKHGSANTRKTLIPSWTNEIANHTSTTGENHEENMPAPAAYMHLKTDTEDGATQTITQLLNSRGESY